MNQEEKRIFLIKELLKEQKEYENMEIPKTALEQKQLLRVLFNVRMPKEMEVIFNVFKKEDYEIYRNLLG